ncbi:hypothetical protein K504DRAFT_17430 [Pleomassaria siparia CBS 279.74]|uniref:Uncharacterized protein n=1 Tax=Pleomassaria siparia CBS 279.74 TaxID=1314801 RepID=A0A6G1KRL9_9PLEO|nr:hypothetical protein K504DRAFT_17430 [Pleomassaria siparia CBS 279.74]
MGVDGKRRVRGGERVKTSSLTLMIRTKPPWVWSLFSTTSTQAPQFARPGVWIGQWVQAGRQTYKRRRRWTVVAMRRINGDSTHLSSSSSSSSPSSPSSSSATSHSHVLGRITLWGRPGVLRNWRILSPVNLRARLIIMGHPPHQPWSSAEAGGLTTDVARRPLFLRAERVLQTCRRFDASTLAPVTVYYIHRDARDRGGVRNGSSRLIGC